MAGSAKRIGKELAEVTTNPPDGITVALASEADLHQWLVTMAGPTESPYSGGHFKLLLELPLDYPFKPPTLNFKTKIFHPNITNDDKGSMCLALIKSDVWKPSSKISAVLIAARDLLSSPNPDDAVEADAARLWKEERAKFNERAKEWTKKYAGSK